MKHNLLIFLLTSLCATQLSAGVASPGENLWHVIAEISTDIDALAHNVASDALGTSTVLQTILDIESTIVSKIDNLQSIYGDPCTGFDFSCVFTVINNITSTGCSCDPVSLTILATGTTINASNVYCLEIPVTLNSGANITLTGSDIVFDLNGNTISGGTGIIVTGSRVTVKNGIVQQASVAGLQLNGSSDATVFDLIINNCIDGLDTINSASNIILDNLKITQASGAGINLNGVTNASVTNCEVLDQLTTTTGFLVQNSSQSITLSNCISDGNSIGFQANNALTIIFDSCSACNNTNGFYIDGTVNFQTACLVNCISKSNTIDGFDILQGNPTSSYVLTNCAAQCTNTSQPTIGFNLTRQNGTLIGCEAIGFLNGFQALSTSNVLLKQNNAIANINAGFSFAAVNQALISECKAMGNSIGFDVSATNTCVVEKCTATANTNAEAPAFAFGFKGNGTTDEIFLLNNAMQNSNNYSGVTFAGSESAPEMTLTSTGRLYGDNLKNV